MGILSVVPPAAIVALAVVGAITIFYNIYRSLLWVSLYALPLQTPSRYLPNGRGSAYALVTGASAGIGLGIAHALATAGFHVVLTGHKPDELAEARNEILAANPGGWLDVRIVVLNAVGTVATEVDAKLGEPLASSLPHPLTVVFNNVGGVACEPPHLKRLREYTAAEADGTMDLNGRFMTHVMRALVPVLARCGGPALVVSTSSFAALGLPRVAVYGASKAHVIGLSKAVAREAREEGMNIDVVAILVGQVRSQGNNMAPPGSIRSMDFGREIVGRVPRAAARGMLVFTPYWRHATQVAMLSCLPESVFQKAMTDSIDEMIRTYEKLVKAQ